jgi:hypothetical protein
MSLKRGRALTAVAAGSVATCYVAYMARRYQRRWQRVKDTTPTRPVHEASDIMLDSEVARFLISYEVSPVRGRLEWFNLLALDLYTSYSLMYIPARSWQVSFQLRTL